VVPVVRKSSEEVASSSIRVDSNYLDAIGNCDLDWGDVLTVLVSGPGCAASSLDCTTGCTPGQTAVEEARRNETWASGRLRLTTASSLIAMSR